MTLCVIMARRQEAIVRICDERHNCVPACGAPPAVGAVLGASGQEQRAGAPRHIGQGRHARRLTCFLKAILLTPCSSLAPLEHLVNCH